MYENINSIYSFEAKNFFIKCCEGVLEKYKIFLSKDHKNKEKAIEYHAHNFFHDAYNSALERYKLFLSSEIVIDNNSDKYINQHASAFLKNACDNALNKFYGIFSNDERILEGNSLSLSEKDKLLTAKESCHNLFESIMPGVYSKYNDYVIKIRSYVVKLQKMCRGRIFRLVHKMDLMNIKLEIENKKNREKIKMRRKSTKDVKTK